MRTCPNPKVEKYRERKHPTMGSNSTFGNNGVFVIPYGTTCVTLTCIVSDGAGWEHVSVEAPGRTPTWEEMDFIKKCFWSEDEVVIQYHISGKAKVNVHPFVLHLWRPIDVLFVMPPRILV